MNKKSLKGALAFGTAFLAAMPAVAPVQDVAAGVPSPPLPLGEFGQAEYGIATWYGERFHGLETANGEIFDMFRMTAAHREIPLGTMVRVTNLENGLSVVVRINDRGPARPSANIDLSYAAAEKLGMRVQGRARVRLDQLIQLSLVSLDSPSRN